MSYCGSVTVLLDQNNAQVFGSLLWKSADELAALQAAGGIWFEFTAIFLVSQGSPSPQSGFESAC